MFALDDVDNMTDGQIRLLHFVYKKSLVQLERDLDLTLIC